MITTYLIIGFLFAIAFIFSKHYDGDKIDLEDMADALLFALLWLPWLIMFFFYWNKEINNDT